MAEIVRAVREEMGARNMSTRRVFLRRGLIGGGALAATSLLGDTASISCHNPDLDQQDWQTVWAPELSPFATTNISVFANY